MGLIGVWLEDFVIHEICYFDISTISIGGCIILYYHAFGGLFAAR